MSYTSRYTKAKPGFTLIELLVVIAIISLISSVVLATVSSARDKARVVNMTETLRQTNLGFTLWMQQTGRQQWPSAFEFAGEESGSITIEDLMSETQLDDYLSAIPQHPTEEHEYRYHQFGDFSCEESMTNTDIARGVHVKVYDFPTEDAVKISEIVDGDADLDCGRARQDSNGTFYYQLSDTVAF